MSTTAEYKPTADEIKRLRDETGAGISDVRNALIWAEGDPERAKARLNETGHAKAERERPLLAAARFQALKAQAQ